MTKQLQSKEEAIRDIEDAIVKVVGSEKFMVAIWSVDDGILSLENHITWQFPTGDFKAAIKLLEKKCMTQLPDDPLPRANKDSVGVSPLVDGVLQFTEGQEVSDVSVQSISPVQLDDADEKEVEHEPEWALPTRPRLTDAERQRVASAMRKDLSPCTVKEIKEADDAGKD